MSLKTTICIVLSLFLISGCFWRDPSRYYNKVDKYSIKFPAGWKKINETDDIVSFAPSDLSTNIIRNQADISVTVEPTLDKITLKEAFFNAIKYEETEHGAELVDHGHIFMSGQDGRWFVSRRESGILAKVYITVRDSEKIYIIFCSVDQYEYKGFSEIFEDTAYSFEFLK